MVIWEVWGSVALTFTDGHRCLPSGLPPLRALAGSFANGTPGVSEETERVAWAAFRSNRGDAWSHLGQKWLAGPRLATSCRRLILSAVQPGA